MPVLHISIVLNLEIFAPRHKKQYPYLNITFPSFPLPSPESCRQAVNPD